MMVRGLNIKPGLCVQILLERHKLFVEAGGVYKVQVPQLQEL